MENEDGQLREFSFTANEFGPISQLILDPNEPDPTRVNLWLQMYRMAAECGDLLRVAYAAQNMIGSLSQKGRYAEALACARRIVGVGVEAKDPLVVVHGLVSAGWAYWAIGDSVAALNIGARALRLSESLGQRPFSHPFSGPEAARTSATELLLTIDRGRGNLRRAVAQEAALLQYHRNAGRALNASAALENLGNIQRDFGNYAGALAYFDEALNELELYDGPDPRVRLFSRAGTLGNIAVVHTYLGETDAALARLEEAFEIYSVLSDEVASIAAYGQKGRALLEGGRVHEALVALSTMLELARKHAALGWQYAAHFNLARAYLAFGSWFDAIAHFESAERIALQSRGDIDLDLLFLRARLFEPKATGAMISHEESAGARFIALSYFALERLQRDMRGSKPAAIVEKWLDEFETVIQYALSLPPLQPLVLLPLEHGDPVLTPIRQTGDRIDAIALRSPFIGWLPVDIALYCHESLRAQEFQERILLHQVDLEASTTELARIDAEVKELEQQFLVASNDKGGNPTEWTANQSELLKRLIERRAARDALFWNTINPTTMASDPRAPVRSSDICALLRDDELFLEYMLLGQNTTASAQGSSDSTSSPTPGKGEAFVVACTRSWVDVVSLGRTSYIEKQCIAILGMLWGSPSLATVSQFQFQSQQVFNLLLAPIFQRAGGAIDHVKHLIIATDGILAQFPIDVLIQHDQQAHSWVDLPYIAKCFSTEYTPAATVFVDTRSGSYRRGKPGDLFVGLGDPEYRVKHSLEQLEGLGVAAPRSMQVEDAPIPTVLERLPGTRHELDKIATLLQEAEGKPLPQPGFDRQKQPLMLLGPDARKDRLLDPEVLLSAEYIHLACHGTAGKGQLQEGALFLADVEKGEPRDGVLTSFEVMNARTNAKLVVMSACETALGKLTRGEGVQGLVRAWLFAGAQSVVATLWSVNDVETAKIMATFYETLLSEPIDYSDALAIAKRTAIGSARSAHPSFWGAFAVFGGRHDAHVRSRKMVARVRDSELCDTEHRQTRDMPPLLNTEITLLAECGDTWETICKSKIDRDWFAFFTAATRLGTARSGLFYLTSPSAIEISLGLVANNCQTAFRLWTKERRASMAVAAYTAHTAWRPDARAPEWDALVDAYDLQNLRKIRDLSRQRQLEHSFVVRIARSGNLSITTSVAWNPSTSQGSDMDHRSSINIAFPLASTELSGASSPYVLCSDLRWAICNLKPATTCEITERSAGLVLEVDGDIVAYAETWGSSLFPYTVTIQCDADFFPMRLERRRLGRASSRATVRFRPEGATVTLRPVNNRPWLERVGLLLRRQPGAIDFFAGPRSPFTEETEFGHFEELLEQVRKMPDDPADRRRS